LKKTLKFNTQIEYLKIVIQLLTFFAQFFFSIKFKVKTF